MHQDILKYAQEYCISNKIRLTAPRAEVLKIIASNSKPIGAYEILEKLAKIIKNPKAPTVYRAIEFWQKHHFIHRIESLNAYMACQAGHRHQGSQFMICDDCGNVIETHLCKLPKPLINSADQNTFTPTAWSLEVHGICGECNHAKTDAPENSNS